MSDEDDSRFSRTEDITERARDLRENVSVTESKLWPRLCRDRMGAPFRKQHPIGPYHADYACVPLKLVVEVDGPFHEKSKDKVCDRFLAKRGWHTLRFSVEDMDHRFRNVLDTIHEHVQLGLLEKKARPRKNTSS